MKRCIKKIAFLLALLAIWALASQIVDNPIACPSPAAVAEKMAEQAASGQFLIAVGATFVRALLSLCISCLSGIVFAFLCRKKSLFSEAFDGIILILRSIPNIAYVILILFWFDRSISVFLVTFLLAMPIVYTAVLQELRQIDQNWKALFHIFYQPFRVRFRLVYFPQLGPTLQAAILSASSLCFKSTVMAEVLIQIKNGIGKSMQYARLNVDLAGVIAWTIWLLLLVWIVDALLKKLLSCFLVQPVKKKKT